MKEIKLKPNDDQKQTLDSSLMWSQTSFNLAVLECIDTFKKKSYIMMVGDIFRYFRDFVERNPQDSLANVDMFGVYHSLSQVQPIFEDFVHNRIDVFPYQTKNVVPSFVYLNRDTNGNNRFFLDGNTVVIDKDRLGKIEFEGEISQDDLDDAVTVVIRKNADNEYLMALSNEISFNVQAAASSKYMINDSIARYYMSITIERIVALSANHVKSNMQFLDIYCKMLGENAIEQKKFLKKMRLL